MRKLWVVVVRTFPGLRRRIVKRFHNCKHHEDALRRAAIWLDEEDGVDSYVVVRVSCRAIGYVWTAPRRRRMARAA